MLKVLAFDIETIRNPEAVPLLPEPQPSTKLKDAKKIKADIKEKKLKQMELMGTQANTCLVCCVSTYNGSKMESFLLSNYEAEGDFLRAIWDRMGGHNRFVTFNGLEFDIPCLLFRSAMAKAKPSVSIDRFKYRIGNHIDVRAVLGNWDKYAVGTQDFYTRLFLGEGKPSNIDGSKVQHYWDLGLYDQVQSYCEDDVLKLWKLYECLIGYYF